MFKLRHFAQPWLRVMAAILVCFGAGCSNRESGGSAVAGIPPAVRVLNLDGEDVDIQTRTQHAATVYIFTRSDCPISNRYAPDVRGLCERFQSRDVEFVLVYVDPREDADSVRRHLKEFDYPCAAVRDPQHALAGHCGATVTPEAAVFDRYRTLTYLGRIDDRYMEIGQSRTEPTARDLEIAIESTLQGQPVAQPRTKAVGCLIADLKR